MSVTLPFFPDHASLSGFDEWFSIVLLPPFCAIAPAHTLLPQPPRGSNRCSAILWRFILDPPPGTFSEFDLQAVSPILQLSGFFTPRRLIPEPARDDLLLSALF